MKRARMRRGATLPEALIVSSLLVILLTGMVTVSVDASGQWSRSTSKMMADNDASLTLQRLARDVRDGTTASVNTGGTELTVTLPQVNSEGDFDRYTPGASVRYYLSSGTLYRQQGTGAAQALGSKVTAVRFAVDGAEVGLQLTTRQQNGTKGKETTLSTQIALRNEIPQ